MIHDTQLADLIASPRTRQVVYLAWPALPSYAGTSCQTRELPNRLDLSLTENVPNIFLGDMFIHMRTKETDMGTIVYSVLLCLLGWCFMLRSPCLLTTLHGNGFLGNHSNWCTHPWKDLCFAVVLFGYFIALYRVVKLHSVSKVC